MADTPETPSALPPRLKRAMEIVYALEGVTSARIWQWPGRVAVGVRVASTHSPGDVLQRVEGAIAPLREPEEEWEFGLLED